MTELADLLKIDRDSIWHPYSAMASEPPAYPVVSAEGVRLKLANGSELIDGMSSWWCAIHGYNQPQMNAALTRQLDDIAHVMFGGLTHRPAMALTEQLLELIPTPLRAVFYSDSGSVSVEVALKMAIQYWHAQGQPQRQKFISLHSAYHGDTLGAMSVCDPVTGMHTLFNHVLAKQYFIDRPGCRFGESCSREHIAPLQRALARYGDRIAAVIMEPIVQGAGGMWFYSAEYLKQAREYCDQYGVLLILDEIATGFARTGRMFACEHAGISPDIMCIGKAMTGGYLTLAATLATDAVQQVIDSGRPGAFMHGPTFMANPLACTAALTSIRLLLDSHWRENIMRIQRRLEHGLFPCRELDGVDDVRVLGAIGVVELKHAVDMQTIVPRFVQAGVWIRPFGRLIYLMPPYIIDDADLDCLTRAVGDIVATIGDK